MNRKSGWAVDRIIEQLQRRYFAESLQVYWHAESAALKTAISALERVLGGRYEPALPESVVGVGGSGIVLRLRDAQFPKVDKALKFPRPVPGKGALLAEMLTKEVSYLAELRHPGIVSISHYDTLSDVNGYDTLPFYLMEYVEGSKSKEFCRRSIGEEREFHRLTLETAKIIAHLHSSAGPGFAHMDIKPDNILVRPDGTPMMIDLGTCKRLTGEDASTTVACTRPFAHPELVRQLAADPTDENRARGELPRSSIMPSWDLWSYALTLLDWLGVDRDDGLASEGALYNSVSTYTRKFYMLLVARLLSYSNRAWLLRLVGLSDEFLKDIPIENAPMLCDVLSRIDGGCGPLAEVSELNMWFPRTIQAAPGTHVAFTPALTKVLSHRSFQRLNNIRQLGLVSQVYLGANHTRREHSLGTYANTCRIIRALYEDQSSPLFRHIVTQEDCRTALLAALLHDIGQFPLAHDLEEIDRRLFDHSDITLAMLRGGARKRKKSVAGAPHPLDEIFQVWGTSAERLIAVLQAKPTNVSASRKDKLLRSIISGPIDADKLDYLFRDARHTDVPYPHGVDVDRIFRCLTTVVVEHPEGQARDVPCIGVHAKGRVAAEFLTLARYAMFSQVYWHHAVRAQKAMLFRAIESLLAGFQNEAQLKKFKNEFFEMAMALPEVLYQRQGESLFPDLDLQDRAAFGMVGGGTDLAPTDAAVLSWLREQLTRLGRPEYSLIDGILGRKLFKRVWVVSYDMSSERWTKIVGLWDQLDRRKRYRVSLEFERAIAKNLEDHGISAVTQFKADEAREKIQDFTSGEMPWLLIDVPGSRPGADVGLHYVEEGRGREHRKNARAVGHLQSSLLWDLYAKNLRQVAGKIRVYCEPSLTETIESSVQRDLALSKLLDVLSDLVS